MSFFPDVTWYTTPLESMGGGGFAWHVTVDGKPVQAGWEPEQRTAALAAECCAKGWQIAVGPS
jgi:hypothetical protein